LRCSLRVLSLFRQTTFLSSLELLSRLGASCPFSLLSSNGIFVVIVTIEPRYSSDCHFHPFICYGAPVSASKNHLHSPVPETRQTLHLISTLIPRDTQTYELSSTCFSQLP
jgi:hypothetical protein